MTTQDFIALYSAAKAGYYDPDQELSARATLREWYRDSKLELDYREQNIGFDSREAREERIRCNTIGAICALFGVEGD